MITKSARVFGYLVAIVVNAVLLYLVNVRPGWQVVPFLTEDFGRVLALVNVSMVAAIVTNLTYVFHDGPRWKALGDLVANGITLAVLIRLWTVFPFAFDASGWTLAVRSLLLIAMVGTAIAMLVKVFPTVGVTGRSVSRHP